ncbi:hypothetical protein ACROYT_G022030 [Oculina patagonica]
MVILVSFSSPAEAHFTCVGTCYKGSFVEENHVIVNKALIGHTFQNVTVYAPHQCLSACVSSCRCLAFQVEGTRCELLDQDRLLASGDFYDVQGYKHFDVKQELNRNEAAGSCMNGCCRTNPCLNGGLCTEHCDNVTVKFSCSCVAGFTGNFCETTLTLHSCSSYYASDSSLQNGVYEISNHNNTERFNVYCDFTSEPGFIWTLVESFEKIKKNDFKNDFLADMPIRANDPQFSEHRLSLSARTHLLSDSTHVRATCEFDKGFSYTDYLRGKLSYIQLVGSNGCKLFERINIRGIECRDCKARYYGVYNEHNHIASDVGQSCGCANCVQWVNSTNSEDSFGHYGSANPNHRCVRNDQATTQWWLGVQIPL